MKRLLSAVLLSGFVLISCGSKSQVVVLDSLPKKEDNSYKEPPKSVYQEEVEKRLTSILKSPVVPLRTPDIVMRVLFLPYVDENGSLIGYHYTYVKMKEGSWILGDYLIEKPYSGSVGNVVNPLSDKKVGGVQSSFSGTSLSQTTQNQNVNPNFNINLPNINMQQQQPEEVE